jgi:uncharacterized membrane protein
MLFVFVSHFSFSYFAADDPRARILQTITLMASPTFMLISGMLVGFLARTRPGRFQGIRIKLADRGLFLLTIGHVLIVAGSWPQVRTIVSLQITDAIGVAMLLGPALVTRLSARARLAVSGAAFALMWIAVLAWHPTGHAGRLVAETLFGSLSPGIYTGAFPIVPWCCLDLAGTALGDWLGVLFLGSNWAGMSRALIAVGAASAASGVALRAAYVALVAAPLSWAQRHTSVMTAMDVLTAPHTKSPPSPGYFLTWGGVGLCFVAMWLAVERRGWARRAIDVGSALGQSSLFMFVAQFYVYFTFVFLVRSHLPFKWAWPAYLAASMIAIVLPTLEYHRRGYRRFITVGFARWYDRRRTARGGRLSPSTAVAGVRNR